MVGQYALYSADHLNPNPSLYALNSFDHGGAHSSISSGAHVLGQVWIWDLGIGPRDGA